VSDTFAKCGHPRTEDNIYYRKDGGTRCRACVNEGTKRSEAKRRGVTFGCGHGRTADNTLSRSDGQVRCRQCHQDKNRLERVNIREMKPVGNKNPSVDGLPQASRSLLAAIQREHPYVITAAIRAGRIPAIHQGG